MHWILQDNLFNESEWATLVSTLERFDIPYSVHKVVPFIGELVPEPDIKEQKVICFGSYSLRHAAKRNGWVPGVYDLFDQNFEIQKKHWGDLMLNYDSVVVPLKNAIIDKVRFIRPIDDSKYFTGRVFDPEEWNNWTKSILDGEDYGNGLTPETKVQVSIPKKIFCECRYWVVDGEIVTKSLYKLGNKVLYSNNVYSVFDDFVNHAISIWQPAKAFVIDVCKIDVQSNSSPLRIVEINTINSAGFYAADIQKLVFALESANI